MKLIEIEVDDLFHEGIHKPTRNLQLNYIDDEKILDVVYIPNHILFVFHIIPTLKEEKHDI